MRISDWSSDVCSSDLAGDKEYTLVMSVNALCEAEDVLGMATDEILARYSSGLSVKLLRGLIWAALQTNHPCTVDEAGEIIEAAGVPSAKTALEQAILASMPAAEAEEKANRSEEHTSELQSLMRISYAVFCLKKNKSKRYKKEHHTCT